MVWAKFNLQTDIPWRTYEVADESHVRTLKDGGPFEVTRIKFRHLPVRMYKWEMPWRTNIQSTSDQRQAIDAFIRDARAYAYEPFLVADPKDPKQTGVALGTANGVLTTFSLSTTRTSEIFRQYPFDAASTVVYDNGVAVATGDRTISTDGRSVTFSVAPTNLHVITVDYYFYRLVMFEGDVMSWSAPSPTYADSTITLREIIRDGV